MHTLLLLFLVSYGNIKEDTGIKAQWRAKNFGPIIKSYLFEGIFVDAKGINCVSLEIVHAIKCLTYFFLNCYPAD